MVREIKIKDKVYPIKISYYVNLQLNKKYGFKSILDKDDDGLKIDKNIEAWQDVLYYGIESGCKDTGETFDLKREDLEFVLDDVFNDLLNITIFFCFGKDVNEVQEQTENDDNKKKSL